MVFAGTPEVALPALDAIANSAHDLVAVVTRPDAPAGRGRKLVASPVVKLVRLVTPKVVLDQHIPIAAFMVVLFAYFWLGFEHRASCRQDLAQPSCDRWAAAWSGGTVKQ